jgi:hypothetical protein
MKVVVDADSGQILGCAVFGSEGGEIMTMIQIAMLGKLTYTDMASAIFTHPLLAEGLNTLFATFDAQALEHPDRGGQAVSEAARVLRPDGSSTTTRQASRSTASS